jgi:hypothetical protein
VARALLAGSRIFLPDSLNRACVRCGAVTWNDQSQTSQTYDPGKRCARGDSWLDEPHDELVNNGNYCLAKPGEIYAACLPHGDRVTIRLQTDPYRVT